MTTESERSYRRRILTSALPDDIPAETLRHSLQVLDQDFGEVENLKYKEVLNRIEDNLNAAEVNVNRLLGRIMLLKRKEPAELKPDPRGGGTQKATTATRTQLLDPRLKVFNTLFGSIAKHVDRKGDLDALRAELLDQIVTLDVSPDCGRSVREWSTGASDPQIAGSNKDLHKIVNHAFVFMCTRFGPIDADKVLIASVRAAEALPEAFDCSPRKFL